MGNLLEDQPDAKGKLEAAGGPMTERGFFGIVERADDHLQVERLAPSLETGKAVLGLRAIFGSQP